MSAWHLDTAIPKHDLEALELAIAQARAEDAGRRGQIDAMLAEDWWDGATFASFYRQSVTLRLNPWECPPCSFFRRGITPDGLADAGGDPALRLLNEMLDLGVSAWHPDPVAAIEAAKRARANGNETRPLGCN
jgi:hypothetical protein